jgi:hypothetical protein
MTTQIAFETLTANDLSSVAGGFSWKKLGSAILHGSQSGAAKGAVTGAVTGAIAGAPEAGVGAIPGAAAGATTGFVGGLFSGALISGAKNVKDQLSHK